MHPILLKIGPFTLFSYGALVATGFLVATALGARSIRDRKPTHPGARPGEVVDLTSLVLLGGLIGGRLFYGALHFEEFLPNLLTIFALWQGGLVWYGGFIGGVITLWIYTRLHGRQFLVTLDDAIPFAALAHAFGRIGCFLNGCCYGKPTDAWYGMTFVTTEEPVIPTQLLEAAGLILIFWVLRRIQLNRGDALIRAPGRLFALYLISYGSLRFGIEFLRGDQMHWIAGLTLQQFISAALIALGLVGLKIVRPADSSSTVANAAHVRIHNR